MGRPNVFALPRVLTLVAAAYDLTDLVHSGECPVCLMSACFEHELAAEASAALTASDPMTDESLTLGPVQSLFTSGAEKATSAMHVVLIGLCRGFRNHRVLFI